MSEPNYKTSLANLPKVINPIWNMSQTDTQVLDTSISDRYYIKVYNQSRVTPDTKDFRFLVQNKVDYLQYSEAFIRVQFVVRTADPINDKCTFSDDVRSFFESVQVKLSNTIIEDRNDIPTIADTERLFWGANRDTVVISLFAYDNLVRDFGSVFSTLTIGKFVDAEPKPQGQFGLLMEGATKPKILESPKSFK